MTTAEHSPTGTPLRPACGWCDSTHIADVSCSCTSACRQGWCPAGEIEGAQIEGCRIEGARFEGTLPNPRDAVA